MRLQSSQLEAFLAVAQSLSFSKGAKTLHITQSAISHRIRNLEDSLGLALFYRHPAGIKLTEAGELLLGFCKSRINLEEQLFRNLSTQVTGQLAGYVRISAYSSVLRSVVIPSLAPFLKENTMIECELILRNNKQVAGLLQSGQVEFALTDMLIGKASISSEVIGYESYVVIESSTCETNPNIYIDNSPEDIATESFFRSQPKMAPRYQRIFLGDCYGIMDGVEKGLGRAVMPAHLLQGNNKIRVVEGFEPYFLEVYLNYFSQPFYSPVQKEIINQIKERAPSFLSKPD
ncbi:MAG: LysR family transcriptional regulator [Oligoflexales bacterium]|nr:LysR family transcriptional regulator [Oligoflexales bacterium]